ncbi:4-hydroxyphenylpyruvate dioxygenase-like protein isoform X2 [Hypanus sabinus]|uniref:4-hydroxyphenylpyruvate dioxygenase-like protein isoform X2 n=1 Tax=Hypanus sabinus TaxID=79690 RepID=UPI0028C3C104|nr:4-hydroxyphenylpyruvate dioxygenase-like protein isoform X2 [Hypanus sabinus]
MGLVKRELRLHTCVLRLRCDFDLSSHRRGLTGRVFPVLAALFPNSPPFADSLVSLTRYPAHSVPVDPPCWLMAAPVQRLSHLAFHVSDSGRLVRHLVRLFRFQLCGHRETPSVRQSLLRRGSAALIVNESAGGRCTGPEGFLYDAAPAHVVDTACNVSFEVKDVERATLNLSRLGCQVLVPPSPVEDELGSVTYSVLGSVVGDVRHTLIDRSNYFGDLLPGFDPCPVAAVRSPEQAGGPVAITHFDHITYACPQGHSNYIMDWYRMCFGFQRFLINRNESVDNGYVIQGNDIGLRLTAMEYWKCSEVGMSISSNEEKKTDCKFVIAESLPYQGKNQVDTFLEEHRGAGIQHVGLYTSDIVSTCKSLVDAGVQFFTPPATYYTEIDKQQEIMKVGEDPELLSRYGILLDSEVDGEHCKEAECHRPDDNKNRYLMQMFTKPIFSEETFFLELIERKGASGFGDGNIRALWKSVQTSMDQHEENKTRKGILTRNAGLLSS